MRGLLTMLAIVLLVSGCGRGSGLADPFQGTWRLPADSATTLVVSRSATGYVLTILLEGNRVGIVDLTRHGDRIEGVVEDPTADSAASVSLTRDPQSGDMTWVMGSETFQLVKDSDSTAVPDGTP